MEEKSNSINNNSKVPFFTPTETRNLWSRLNSLVKDGEVHSIDEIYNQLVLKFSKAFSRNTISNTEQLLDAIECLFPNEFLVVGKTISSKRLGKVSPPKAYESQEFDSVRTGQETEEITAESSEDDLLVEMAKAALIPYIDYRVKGGCLWIFGGKECTSFIEQCESFGATFQYKKDGVRASLFKPAWWTKDIIKKIDDDSEQTEQFEDDANVEENSQEHISPIDDELDTSEDSGNRFLEEAEEKEEDSFDDSNNGIEPSLIVEERPSLGGKDMDEDGCKSNAKREFITSDISLNRLEKQLAEDLNGKQLWGDLELSREEYKNLKTRVYTVLKRDNGDIRKFCWQFPNVITTLLVFLARYKYDTNFWGLVSEEIGIRLDPNTEGFIGESVRKTLTRRGFDFSDVSEEPRKNIAPILYEAGLPPESSYDCLFYVLDADSFNQFDPQLIIDDLVESRSYFVRKPMKRFLERFRGDRAIDFLIEMHDAMISVDQNMGGESAFTIRYNKWKTEEYSKEGIKRRKRKEEQAKPYMHFDDGRKGLCLVLPRLIIRDEWVEKTKWIISGDNGYYQEHVVLVFGDDGRRYTETIEVAVSPSSQYSIKVTDAEDEQESDLMSWDMIEGVPINEVRLFNANGRRVSSSFLQKPFSIAIIPENALIHDQHDITIQTQYYPTIGKGYSVVSIMPLGSNARVAIEDATGIRELVSRPQIDMSLIGKTLFSLPETEGLFVEPPTVIIETENAFDSRSLEMRIGSEQLPLQSFFVDGKAQISLKDCFNGHFERYGIYSVRIYRRNSFLKQIEFKLCPNVKSDYTATLYWPDVYQRDVKQSIFIKRSSEWDLEFSGNEIHVGEERYRVDYTIAQGVLNGNLRVGSGVDNAFACRVQLPITPFIIELIKAGEEQPDNLTGRIERIGLIDFLKKEQWLRITCYGEYINKEYQVVLRTVNGIEQRSYVKLAQSGSSNISLSAFYDTLSNCSLPAQIELYCYELDKTLPLVVITELEYFKKRPLYSNGQIAVDGAAMGDELIVKRFGVEKDEQTLNRYRYTKDSKGDKWKVFSCNRNLKSGLYVIEPSNQSEELFKYDSEEMMISDGLNTQLIGFRPSGQIQSFSDWINQFITDILNRSDISKSLSFSQVQNIKNYRGVELSQDDIERLIAVAYFVNSKCSNQKKEQMRQCMREISAYVLNDNSRTRLIKMLIGMRCPQEIFSLCMDVYSLLLVDRSSSDVIQMAEEVEPYSSELSVMLLMESNQKMQTLWKSSFRQLVGKEALRSLLSVPGEDDANVIAEEQKKFIKGEKPNRVRIQLSKEITGEMEHIKKMLPNALGPTPKEIYLRTDLKPDTGTYFAGIRYVDQYVNWYRKNHKYGEIDPNTKQKMVSLVQEYGKELLTSIDRIQELYDVRFLIKDYENAMSYRLSGDPLQDLRVNRHDRYFYLEGMAAFLAKIPIKYRCTLENRLGREFMARAIAISPTMARRDLILAATYIYLKQKEN